MLLSTLNYEIKLELDLTQRYHNVCVCVLG